MKRAKRSDRPCLNEIEGAVDPVESANISTSGSPKILHSVKRHFGHTKVSNEDVRNTLPPHIPSIRMPSAFQLDGSSDAVDGYDGDVIHEL